MSKMVFVSIAPLTGDLTKLAGKHGLIVNSELNGEYSLEDGSECVTFVAKGHIFACNKFLAEAYTVDSDLVLESFEQ